MSDHDETRSSRRHFVRTTGALAVAGLAGCARPGEPGAQPSAAAAATGEVQQRQLGKTGLKVSVVGAGAGNLSGGPSVLRRALTNGVSYIDTSMCYMGGRSEEIVGKAVKGLRDQVIITTKWDAGPDHSKAQLLKMLDDSLRRLDTDHIDLMLIHQLGDHLGRDDNGFNRLANPHLYEAIEAAKSSGKIRFAGASSHVGKRAEILRKAIDSGAMDVVLVSYNFSNYHGTGVPELLAYAKQKKIGVVAMKAGQGNREVAELAGSQLDLYQANLKWCLQQGAATVICSRIGNSIEHQDKALEMARGDLQVGSTERELLDRYAAAVSTDYCRGCNHVCEPACPAGVRIADVLRYRMYAEHYGDREQATSRYAALQPSERLGVLCGECTLCEQSCPHGLLVVQQLYESRHLLA